MIEESSSDLKFSPSKEVATGGHLEVLRWLGEKMGSS